MEIDQIDLTSTSYKQKWAEEWKLPAFRKKFFALLVSLTLVLVINPFFFDHIQHRHGIELNDWVLNFIPGFDVSLPILLISWGVVVLAIVRSVQDPHFLILFGWTYILLAISRIITIILVPLDQPRGLVNMHDPILNIFYGGQPITKDLFYSGHTAITFLTYLCFRGKYDKPFALFCTIAMAILLLVQHVHYTIDVVSAPFFTYLLYLLSKKLVAY